MFIRSQKGFSLLEILVVVSLVATLTGISVVNYRKYQRSSKMTEAQTSLSQIYMAEKAFFVQWTFYTTDLYAAGAHPEGSLIYNAGFSGNVAKPDEDQYRGPTLDGNRNNYFTLCGKDVGDDEGPVKSCAFKSRRLTDGFTPPDIPQSSPDATVVNTVGAKQFVAVAIADLIDIGSENTSSTDKDIWSIDQYKQVSHCQDGTSSGGENSCTSSSGTEDGT